MWCCGGMKVATDSSSAAKGDPTNNGGTTSNAFAIRRRMDWVDS